MKFIKRIVMTILMVVIVFSVTSPVLATDRYEPWQYDKHNLIVFTPHIDFGDTSILHMNDALYQFNQAAGYTMLRREPYARHTSTNYPIYSPSGYNRVYRVGMSSFNPPGMSVVFFNKISSGEIIVYEANIAINVSHRFSNGATNDQYDLWTIFIHEAGHILGLNHPSTSMLRSVMQVMPINSINREVSLSDKNMLNSRLYSRY